VPPNHLLQLLERQQSQSQQLLSYRYNGEHPDPGSIWVCLLSMLAPLLPHHLHALCPLAGHHTLNLTLCHQLCPRRHSLHLRNRHLAWRSRWHLPQSRQGPIPLRIRVVRASHVCVARLKIRNASLQLCPTRAPEL